MSKKNLDFLIREFVRSDLRWLNLYGFTLDAQGWSNGRFSISVVFDDRESVIVALVDEINPAERVDIVDGIPLTVNRSLRNQIPNVYIALRGHACDAILVDQRIRTREQAINALGAYSRMIAYVIPQLLDQSKFEKLMKKQQQFGTSALSWL